MEFCSPGTGKPLCRKGFPESGSESHRFLWCNSAGLPRACSLAGSGDGAVDILVARFSSLSNCYFGNLREAPLTEKKIRYRYWCVQVTPNLKIQIVPC